jgi:acyl-coenzyme A synthetase/AMP-(fatty) acid ligase
MKMPLQDNRISVYSSLIATGDLSARVMGAEASASWCELTEGFVLNERLDDLVGCSVVLATVDQFSSAAALVQLDGVARRVVLCPPDLSRENLAFVTSCSEADVIVADQPGFESISSRVRCIVSCARKAHAKRLGWCREVRGPQVETEWVLLTSGTTGRPKLVSHTLASLAGAIEPSDGDQTSIVWSTFYDTRRYGGLQILLRSALAGTSLILKGAQESVSDFLDRAGALGVTHISGTPSQWRHALMSPSASNIAPEYVRLSGEIVDQSVLNHLRQRYPSARISHAFASTEAGVAFEVKDGEMGFPAELLEHSPDVEMKVENHTLRVRSPRTACRYLNEDSEPLKDAEGFVDTGDVLELRSGRYYFVGRHDGTVNVGGMKVHPEEVEAVLNRHPAVSVSLVKTKKSPIAGSLVVADVVLKTSSQPDSDEANALQSNLLEFCRAELARHKVPVAINFVQALAVAESGKLVRPLA